MVSGYAFCDIVVTTLRQNADQALTGTCGPTAWLAALSIQNPAGSIKKGLELYWTGTMPEIPAAVPALSPHCLTCLRIGRATMCTTTFRLASSLTSHISRAMGHKGFLSATEILRIANVL